MTSLKILSLTLGSSLLLGACTGFTNTGVDTGDQTQSESQTESADTMMEGEDQAGVAMDEEGATQGSSTYTLSEVAQHNNPPDDCWLVIEGNVYDVSGFAEAGHGGGEAVYQGCGIDATELFETRPMGSGTPHSDNARSFFPNFLIGELAEEE